MPFRNLKYLKDDMVNEGWTICCFEFEYKEIDYFVLVKRFVGSEQRISRYALVKLHFIKVLDWRAGQMGSQKTDLEVEANTKGLIIDAKTLREYFGIEWRENLREILGQFTNYLGRFIPKKIPLPTNMSQEEKDVMVYSLSNSDSESPDKKYCFSVRRNPKGQKRSEFNLDKTKILRPKLFEIFQHHYDISFCYSINPEEEKNDDEILHNFRVKIKN